MRLIVLIALFILIPIQGETADNVVSTPAADWLRHIRVTCRKVFSIKADMRQEVITDEAKPPVLVAHAALELRRKGRARVTYDSPQKAIFVTDGETTWFYNRETRTAYDIPLQDTIWTQLFDGLLGSGDLAAFTVSHIGGNPDPAMDPGDGVLQIVPITPEPFIAAIILTVGPTVPCLKRVMLVTRRQHIIRFTLSNIQYNVGIGAKRFTFTPPGRAKIITQ
jgi:outer membrane lipoprotein-sorting protein